MKLNNENKDVVKVDIVVDVEKSEEIHDKTSPIIFVMPKGEGVKSGIVGAFSVKTLLKSFLALKELEDQVLNQISNYISKDVIKDMLESMTLKEED